MIDLPLAAQADGMLRRLGQATSSESISRLDGKTLLGERAMLADWRIPGLVSAGGGAHLFAALGDMIAINLARPDDRALLPALFETTDLHADDDQAIGACFRRCDAAALVARGRAMGLALAAEHEGAAAPPAPPVVTLAPGLPSRSIGGRSHTVPRVLDVSALWAGPLAAHLLWLAGADVVKVESRTRPDGMRHGDQNFFSLLNQGKDSVVLDFGDRSDRQVLAALLAASDIVIESARPRGLAQIGIDAARIVATTPGLVWVTITAHGAHGAAADWVGFGDDCGVAAGLSAALRSSTGRTGFVGDAIADPLTGVTAALAAWSAWQSGQGARLGLALSHVAAHCLEQARTSDPDGLAADLMRWGRAVGRPFPAVQRRPIGRAAIFGEHTQVRAAQVAGRAG